MMMPNQIEVLNRGFVKLNVLLWNCRGALNTDSKRRVLEIMVNHFPAIMMITETRIGGDRAKMIIEELTLNESFVTDTIGYVRGLWLL